MQYARDETLFFKSCAASFEKLGRLGYSASAIKVLP